MTESRKTFAEWMRAGEALNMPGGFQPDPAASADAASFVLPPDEDGGEERYFNCGEHRKGGVDDRRMQGIARGKVPVEDAIDLHGWTAAEAHARLEEFLRGALSCGARVVEVVHGRGLRAEGGRSILRAKTRKWLAQCEDVLGFVEPRKNTGAVRVLLRKNPRGRGGG